jgi:DNA-binding transcriptional MerR regulator
MKEKLKDLKERKFIGALELADEAARFIPDYVPPQERGSVAEVPDERMVRYYIAEGLLSPPEARQGSASVYGYRHLLQLLVIKRLQSDHLPIKKIREICENRNAHSLEQMLGVGKEREKPSGNEASEYLESLLRPYARAQPSPRLQAPSPGQAILQSASAWARIEIEPGLELHVREDYRLMDDAKERQRLARRIMAEIEKRS